MDQKQTTNFSLRSDVTIRKIFWCLLGFEFFIVFLDVFVSHYRWTSIGAIRRMVNITREDSLSNWFSSLQLIIVGTILLLTAFTVKNQIQNTHVKKRFYCWAGIAVFFFYMGIDDAIKFHERIGTAFKIIILRSAESSGTGILFSIYNAFPSYPWQMVFGPFFAAMGFFMIWFLYRELSSQKLKYLLTVAIWMYALAVGMDFVEGLGSDPYVGLANFFSTETYRIRHMSKTIEEFLEMFGTTIFLIVFLGNLFRQSQEWKIKVYESK